MPRINARRMAEMITLPAYAQLAILEAEKNPKSGSSQFKIPYYAPVVTAIRASYRSDDPGVTLAEAAAKAQGIGQESRRQHVLLALEKFVGSDQMARRLKVETAKLIESSIAGVDLRMSPDLHASDTKGPIFLFYNMKTVAYDSDAARRLLEISHWICEQAEIDVAPNRIELIDLSSGKLHRTNTRRESTIKQMKSTAKAIAAMWDGI